MTEDATQRLDRLESLVEQQQEQIQQQQKRLQQQANTIRKQRDRLSQFEPTNTDADSTPEPTTDDSDPNDTAAAELDAQSTDLFSRRSLLQGAAVLGLGGFATGAASAADPRGVIGSESHPVKRLYLSELMGPLTEGASLTSLTGNGLAINGNALSIGANAVDSTELANDSVTVAGNEVALGTSTGIDYVDLADTGNSFPIPNADLANDSVTIDGNEVALGGSTTISHTTLSDVNPGDHHTRPSVGDGLVDNSDTFSIALTQGGSGTGVLGSAGTGGIENRSLLGANGIAVSERDGTVSVGTAPSQANITNTFPDSIVSTSGDATVTNDAITLSGSPSTTVDRGKDNRSSTAAYQYEKHGVRFVPKVQISSITLTVSDRTSSDIGPIYITDTSFNSIASKTAPDPGNSVTLNPDPPLSVGTDYFAVVDENDETIEGYFPGYRNSVSFPITSPVLNITAGVDEAAKEKNDTNKAYCIRSLTVPVSAGNATVEWSQPASVSRWENAAFGTERNGEQLDVYAQTSSDGSHWGDWDIDGDGNAEPIARGTDLSSIPPDDRVRFRASLATRSSNKPRLTNLIRQWRG